MRLISRKAIFCLLVGVAGNASAQAIYDSLNGRFILPKESGLVASVGGFCGPSLIHSRCEVFCSAVAIGSHEVMVPNHCLKAITGSEFVNFTQEFRAIKADLWSQVEETGSTRVYFTFAGEANWGRMWEAGMGVETVRRDLISDFAILRMPHTNLHFVNIHVLKQTSERFNDLTLVSHFSGLPLIETSGCEGAVWKEKYLLHNCASIGGSSGGLLIDREQELPIGMHIKGFHHNVKAFFQKENRFESRADLLKAFCHGQSKMGMEDCLRFYEPVSFNLAVLFSSLTTVSEH